MGNIIDRLLRDRTQDFRVQLLRYTAVGGFAFLVDYGTLWLLTEYAGMHYLASAVIAFLLGLAVNYALSTLWVFSAHRVRSRTVEFFIFAAIGIVGLGLNEAILWLGTDVLHLHYMLSKMISTVLVFFWNFLIRRFTLFR